MSTEKSRRLSLNVSQEVADKLLKLKEANGTSLTEIIRDSVNLYFFLDNERKHDRLVQTVEKNGKDRKEIIFS